VLEQLEMPPGVVLSGLEFRWRQCVLLRGATSGKVEPSAGQATFCEVVEEGDCVAEAAFLRADVLRVLYTARSNRWPRSNAALTT